MNKFFSVLLALSFASYACLVRPAVAQEVATGGGVVELIDLKLSERTIEGELDGCEYTYLLGYKDFIYGNGAAVGLRGAISVQGFSSKDAKQPIVILKVTGFDVFNSTATPFGINYAYLSGEGVSYARKEYVKFTCDDGGYCAGYTLIDKPEIGMMLSSDFEINYNRRAGGSDVTVPIRPLRDRPVDARKFSACVLKGMDILLKRNHQ